MLGYASPQAGSKAQIARLTKSMLKQSPADCSPIIQPSSPVGQSCSQARSLQLPYVAVNASKSQRCQCGMAWKGLDKTSHCEQIKSEARFKRQINALDRHSDSPLSWAARSGHLDAARGSKSNPLLTFGFQWFWMWKSVKRRLTGTLAFKGATETSRRNSSTQICSQHVECGQGHSLHVLSCAPALPTDLQHVKSD